MKKLLLLCCILAAFTSLQASEAVLTSFPEKSYDDVFVYEIMDSDADLTPLFAFADKYSKVIASGNAPIYITSYSNTSPVSSTNSKNAVQAAELIKNALSDRGVAQKNIVTEAFSGLYDENAPIVIVRVGIPEGSGKNLSAKYKAATPNYGSGSMIIPRSTGISGNEPAPAKSKIKSSSSLAGEWNLRTNAVIWATTTINAGLEWRYSQKHSIMVNGGWARWNWDNDYRTWRTWFVMPEFRWYLGQNRNWYLGLQGQYGDLHFMLNDTGYQGEFYGGSVTMGYMLPIGRKLSLDFGLGLGFTQYNHDKYEWMNTYPVNQDIRTKTETDCKFNLYGPNFASISLVWHMNRR